MITPRVCEVIWFAGIVGWYIIRYPFERKAKRVRVSKSLFGRRIKPPGFCLPWFVCGTGRLRLDWFSKIIGSPVCPSDRLARVANALRRLVVVFAQPRGSWTQLVDLT